MKLFSFGLFADCQYANKKKAGTRYYKRAAKKLRECVQTFNRSNLAFVVNLGDLIDDGFDNFGAVLDILSRLDAKLYHLVGNHDYNVKDHEKGKILKLLGITCPYSSFTVHATLTSPWETQTR